ncbi:hypothetical protein BCR36DRAFT_467070, partial [Piromyces finnis]
IFSYLIFHNQTYTSIIFKASLNSLCYFILFLLFSWDKVYYILKNKGNDAKNYFIFNSRDKCVIHNSYTCECKNNSKESIDINIISKYIYIYKLSSRIIYLHKGNVKFDKYKSKMTLISISNDYTLNKLYT